jgi:peptide/nickel transport system substrate-binding protein
VTGRGRRPGWRTRIIGPSALLALLAAGCGTPATSASPKVTYVGVAGGTISLGISQSPTGCNPHTVSGDNPTTGLLLDGVLPSPYTVDPQGSVSQNQNLITQGEVVSLKPETIVYTLNPKARWADGVPITAADFIYNWQQQRSDPSAAQDTVATILGYKDIESVKGSNSGRTVTVKFKTPFADWEMLFANLMPAHILEKLGWNPTCSTVDPAIDISGGPFEIATASATTVRLIDNPHWWGVKPNSRSIVIHIASSTDQLAQWMRSGYTQMVLPSTVTPSFLTQMASLPGTQTQVDVSNTLLQLEMASGPEARLSPDMRFALALTLNRQEIVNQEADWAKPGTLVADSHLFVQGQPGYHASPSTASPGSVPTTSSSTTTTLIGQVGGVNFPTTPVLDQAAALMTASGFVRDGSPWHTAFGVPFTLGLVVDDGDPWATATAPLVQSQLEAGGFSVVLYYVQSAADAGAVLANGYADLALLPRTSTPFLSQTLSWYTMALGPPGQNGSQDWSGYSDSRFTQLVTSASQQLAENTAAADYAQADTQLWNEMVGLPLFAEPSTLVWSRSLGGVQPTPRSDSLLWYAQFWAVEKPESTTSTTPSLPGQ